MSEDVASFEKWKEKKKQKSQKGYKKNDFSKKRKWMTEQKQIQEMTAAYSEFDVSKAESFEDYPLSPKTKMGLETAGYTKPTVIQQASFAPAIQGRDILGAAKTGSGKTLAFLIPVLECLYREQWTSIAGPGALIISPTRELAYQTFEVLKKIGKFHDFSAGLVIGGKDVTLEASRMSKTNILICTPGRLLQHMDETVNFDMATLQVLVLDEADRILDMGFQATLNAIIGNLPQKKQTLLFSATQTRSVKDLARLSLRDPAYVAVHEKSKTSTPSGLNQSYVLCKLNEKLNILYSFIKTHLKAKTLVFFMSCKQVQYVHAAFCKLRPGVPTMMLHGKMNQMRRMEVYDEFCRKKFALLFCTDIAARGLDFPAIDWVVQMDCPEDAETYIHRAGRTARYHGKGQALLFLLESEKEGMLQQLKERKVPITKTEINTEKITNISSRLASFCAAEVELKERAKRCLVSYLRSVHLMKNKSVFSVQSLPIPAYAESLGLAYAPRVRFLQRQRGNQKQGTLGTNDRNVKAVNEKSNIQKDDPWSFDVGEPDSEPLLTVERRDIFKGEDPDTDEEDLDTGKEDKSKKKIKAATETAITRVGAIKKLLKKNYKYNKKIIFDDDGEVKAAWPPIDPKTYKEGMKEPEDELPGLDIKQAIADKKERDKIDNEEHKMKVKQKHQEMRWKEKQERREQQAAKGGLSKKKDEDETVAYLGADSDGGGDSDDSFGQISGDEVETFDVGSNSDNSDNEMPAKRLKKAPSSDQEEQTFTRFVDDDGHSLKDDEKLALYLLQR